MGKVNIIRWDETNFLPKLLDENDIALVNAIDTTGSIGVLSIGSGSATQIILGKIGTSVIISGSSLAKADFTASAGLKVTASVDLPGQQSFRLDGIAITTNNFTAVNLSRLFNGSNVDDLHTHTISVLSSSLLLNPDIVHEIPVVAGGLTGSQVVYINAGSVDLADADTASTSRVIGIASGSTTVTYNSGSTAKIYTIYGDIFDGFTGLSAGNVYYLSTTPGAITTTPAVGGGRAVVQVGIARSSTELIFQPNIIVRGVG